jgi:hypothetical protein
MQDGRDNLLRRYAAADLSWRELQEAGFADYVEVLAGLASLGLRPPIAPLDGPNAAIRRRGIAMLREAIRQHGHGDTDADAEPRRGTPLGSDPRR